MSFGSSFMAHTIKSTSWPFRVVSTTDTTIVLRIDVTREIFSRDRVVESPAVVAFMRSEILYDEKCGVQHECADE